MCGIVAIFAYASNAAPAEATELDAIRDRMAARGPDGTGAWRSADGRVALGHRRLGMIDGTPAWNRADRRHATFLQVAAEHGVELDDSCAARDAPSADGGRRATERLLAGQPGLSAILAFNDLMAGDTR